MYDRPVAPGPPENSVSPVKTTPRSGTEKQTAPGAWPGVCSTSTCVPATSSTCPSRRSPSGSCRAVREVPQHPVVGVQQHRRADPLGQLGGAAHVVVVRVGAGDGHDGAVADCLGDDVRVVRRVEHQHLGVVAEQPHVVVDLEGLAVQAERPAVTRCSMRAAIRGPPRPTQHLAPLHPVERLLDPLEPDPLGNEPVQVESALQVQVDEHGKSWTLQAVAVPGRLERTAPAEHLDEAAVRAASSGDGHADEHDGAGQVARLERLPVGLRPADGVDDDVRAEPAGEVLQPLHHVAGAGVEHVRWRRTPWPS